MVDTLASAGSSAESRRQVCPVCSAPARYTCPRCATPTCSLPCSRKHKQDTGCSGERDKIQRVPMNAYGWGTMMRDYCYLEEVGRKISDWGNEIVRGGYAENINARKTANAQRKSWKKSTAGKSKRDILKAHLETLGIDVELLPTGMERRTMNQSTFDQKSKSPLLTVEFVVYPPAISCSPTPSYRILSHRNSLSATLLTMLQRQAGSALLKSQKQKEDVPDWVPSIVVPHPEAPDCFVPPHCYARAHTEFPHPPNVAYYHKLEPKLSLSELLQGTSFVEFPTIHVFDPAASSFCGTVIDKSGSIVRVSEDDPANTARPAKQRKLNKTVGLKRVFSLIDGYGSDDNSNSDGEETSGKRMAGLATLEAYSGSDDETGEEHLSHSDDDVHAEGNQLDPSRLLELVRQAQSAADEDVLDWGDEWNTDVEEQNV